MDAVGGRREDAGGRQVRHGQLATVAAQTRPQPHDEPVADRRARWRGCWRGDRRAGEREPEDADEQH
jgi:hypothetical protein